VELHGCSDEATPSRTTTWRPLILPRSVVGKGGQSAGLKRLAAVRKYLDAWVRAFCDTTLVAAEAGGLDLRARRTFKEGSVVVTGFLDAQAPATPISQSKGGVPILGLNAARRDRETTAAVAALIGIKKDQDILGLYGDCRWTCARAGCKRPVARTLED